MSSWKMVKRRKMGVLGGLFGTKITSNEQRICELNKKVTYRQRGSIETKKALLARVITTIGASFIFKQGEVVESALFEKIVRDCKGNLMRTESVRRFRKVGSDEWFSISADKGNQIWKNSFEATTSSQAIEQGIKNEALVSSIANIKDLKGKGIDFGLQVDERPTLHTEGLQVNVRPTLQSEGKPDTSELQTSSDTNKKAMIKVAVAAILVFAGYKLLKSQ